MSIKTENEGMIFISAGEFIMGTSDDQVKKLINTFGRDWPPAWYQREFPQRTVFLDSYWIDKYPVTNRQYKNFVDETGNSVPWRSQPLARPFNWDQNTKMYPQGKADHPVVLITWYDAAAYAKWAGKRLPTEAEWEKAARGADGRIWPWGNEWDPDGCNNALTGPNSTTPVTKYESYASPFDVVDMAGNVWEWCDDWFDERYHFNSSSKNPRGPKTGTSKLLRGGCWYDEYPQNFRCAWRDRVDPKMWEFYRGFRCAQDA